MERKHRAKLYQLFGQNNLPSQLYVADIPDEFEFMDDELCAMLQLEITRIANEL